MPRHVRAVTAAACVLLLPLTACGGSSGAPSAGAGSGDVLGRSELASKGSAICRDVAARTEAVEQPEAVDVASFARYLGRVAPLMDELERRLKALRPADEVRPAWEALISRVAETGATLEAVDAKARGGDEAGATRAVERLDALEAGSDAAARAVGLGDCH